MTRKDQYPSFLRLMEVMRASGPSDLAKKMKVTEAVATNWAARGVPKKGAISAERLYGRNVGWLLDGIEQVAPIAATGIAWPFEDIAFSRWNRLTERQKGRIERAINDEMERIESEQRQANG